MNDETVLPNETQSDQASEPASETGQETNPPSDNWTVGEEESESTQETIVIVDYTPVIQDIGVTISGAVLFGAFMIAGILIAFRIMGGNSHG